MSFLNQLKSQATALQAEKKSQSHAHEANTQQTEGAAKTALVYVTELARQLNVIAPDGPTLNLDGKTPWPTMKLTDFIVDARKKTLHGKEVVDYIAIGWNIVPRMGMAVGGSVSANFPPELQRIESRLQAGAVKHDRIEVRHPEKRTLQAIRFDYTTRARGSVTITPQHDEAKMAFRMVCVQGFDTLETSYSAAQIQPTLLDELAKLIVGQTSRFF